MKKALFVGIIIILIIKLAMNTTAEPNSTLEYIITETGAFDSFDPLDADKTQNLPVARMIYATPIEIDKTGKLSSRIFSDFSYDENKKQLHFLLNQDAFFSDNSPIRCKDVVIAILRMLYLRPNFPVIKHIVGKDSWLKHKFPLRHQPDGIVIEQNRIKISFNENVPNSLFRLSLELFSIVPYEVVNLENGSLRTNNFATSGLYTIAEKNSGRILFRLRSDLFNQSDFPKNIFFKYKNIASLTEEDFTPTTIVSGNEADLIYSKKTNLLQKINVQMFPSARFATIRFNTKTKPFDNKLCRLYFSEQLRKTVKNSNFKIDPEGSLFTNLVPGYISHDALRKKLYNLQPAEEKKCLEDIKAGSFNLADSDNNTLKLGFELIVQTLKDLGVENFNIHKGLTSSKITEDFALGNLSIVSGASGFWALDPVGDVEMYFTKNLHQTLKYVWEDNEIYTLIKKIDRNNIRLSLESLNKHIFSDSRLGVFMHFRRFYATNKDLKVKQTSNSISVSPPWLLDLVPSK